jgi:hypothetical protein
MEELAIPGVAARIGVRRAEVRRLLLGAPVRKSAADLAPLDSLTDGISGGGVKFNGISGGGSPLK